MATITGLTAERMKEIEDASVVDGTVDANGNLILTKFDGSTIDAGPVVGPQGVQGAPGIDGAGHIICTSDTRPALLAADEGKTIYETDTDLVWTWDGYLWHVQDRIICTSTTRPTGLTGADIGVKIYETDSKHEFIWSGVGWDYAAPPPIGIIASGVAVATPANNQMLNLSTVLGGNPAWLSGHVITLPANAGGLYLMQLEQMYRSDNVVGMGVNIRNGTGVAYNPEMGFTDSHNPSSANVRHHASWLRQWNGGEKFSIRHAGNPPATPGFQQVLRFSMIRIAEALATS